MAGGEPKFANDNAEFDPFGSEAGYQLANVRGQENKTALYARVLRLRDQKLALHADLQNLESKKAPQADIEARKTQLAIVAGDLAEAERELNAVNEHLSKQQKA